MKATIEFNLPEEQSEHLAAVHAMDWKLVVWNFDQMLRRLIKHDIPTTHAQLLEHLNELQESRGISLED